MKVILINGSPHEKGCTNRALEEIKNTLSKEGIDSEIIWIGNKHVQGCIACNYCKTHNKCVFNDDKVNQIIQELDNISGIIVGSPVYFGGPNGQLCSFLDRLFYSSKNFKYKVGAAIVSCRRGGATASFDRLNKYFTISNMYVISSQYWNMVHGNTPAEVEQDIEGLQTMRTLALNMAYLLKCIDAGKKAGIHEPNLETPIKTNFVR